MSNRYKGAVISATPPTTTGGESGTASGAWTLEQQMQLQAAGLWPIQPLPKYIEDVFSTYLYTGNGSSQTITNGINVSGQGGLVWIKPRSLADNHSLFDTARGALNRLRSNDTTANVVQVHGVDAFNTTGFSITGANGETNQNATTYASWTFRKQPKFFDIVTYTGNAANRTIAHNLGSVPGCIIVKRTDSTSNWAVYHKDLGVNEGYAGKDFHIWLNLTNAQDGISDYWNRTAPTSTVFSIGASAQVNTNGGTYIAYIFAHDAGGFGLTGTDNVISCGTFTPGAGGGATVTLGYEPQWILVKVIGTTGNWTLIDTMRNYSLGGNPSGTNQYLRANTSGAELEAGTGNPTATGFFIDGVVAASQPHIYIAIRRGPMAVPTVGTSVFSPNTATGSALVTTNFPVDASISSETGASTGATWGSRLQGTKQYLLSYNTGAEASFGGNGWGFSNNTGLNQALYGGSTPSVFWNFQRAPGYMDVVCYTGTGVARTVAHNLAAVPELIIVKGRSLGGYSWFVYDAVSGNTKASLLNTTGIPTAYFPPAWNNTTPTSTVFSVGTGSGVNESAQTYVAYLFATCAGVSKVGSYTGNGSTQTINCGFTGGARFVLIKRTDATGDWYVYDTARGMTTVTDPLLKFNTTGAEVATTGSVTTVATGFALNYAQLPETNESGGTYIFLAIA